MASDEDVRLLGPDDDPVAIDVRPLSALAHWYPAEVHPHEPLEPHTQYTLVVEPPHGEGETFQVGFTTGTHFAADEEVPPLTATLEVLEADESFPSCVGGNTVCVGVPHSRSVEARVQWEDHLSEPSLESGTFVRHYSPPSTEAPFCLELRNRNLAAATSEPTVVCTEDAVRYRTSTESLVYLDFTCGADGFSALPEGASLVEPNGDRGCSVSGAGAPRTGGPWTPVLLLAALGLTAARRRSSTSTSLGAACLRKGRTMMDCKSGRGRALVACMLGAGMGIGALGCGDDDAGGNGGPGNGNDAGPGNGGPGNGIVSFAITRASVDSEGQEGMEPSYRPAISADGTKVVFTSENRFTDEELEFDQHIYLRDLSTRETIRVSVGPEVDEEAGGLREADFPAISADGRYVAFVARPSLEAGAIAYRQVYLRDLQTGETHLITQDDAGNPADGGGTRYPSLSDDGNVVAYQSSWDPLTGDSGLDEHIYVYDRQSDQTVRASVNSQGDPAALASGLSVQSQRPSISGDGRYVAFASDADNLVEGDTNERRDVFVHDLQTGETTRVSVDNEGAEGQGTSRTPSMSADGRHVAFYSTSDFAGGTDILGWVYVRDREEGGTYQITHHRPHDEYPSIGSDGRHLAYVGADNGATAIYWRDREADVTVQLARGDMPAIAAEGHAVAFESGVSDLVEGDTNDETDVFVAVIE